MQRCKSFSLQRTPLWVFLRATRVLAGLLQPRTPLVNGGFLFREHSAPIRGRAEQAAPHSVTASVGSALEGTEQRVGRTGSSNEGPVRVRLTLGCGLAVLAAMLLRLSDASAASAAYAFGPYGPEGPRLREQLWLLPSGDGVSPLRATVFRPVDEAKSGALRRPLVVINHGTSDATRLAVSMPVYYWLSRWFVERGYVVVLPQRRGHGATGGPIVDSFGSCSNPDHFRSGLAAADDIEAVVSYMGTQPFVQPGATVVVGISTGDGPRSRSHRETRPRSAPSSTSRAGAAVMRAGATTPFAASSD